MDVVPAGDESCLAPSVVLPLVIERARRALAAGGLPDAGARQRFLEALGQMIREAMGPDAFDAAFQAMVLRHRMPVVREYASLFAHAAADRRRVIADVNAIAHPGRRRGLDGTMQAEGLARLHAAACGGAWETLFETAQGLHHEATLANESERTLPVGSPPPDDVDPLPDTTEFICGLDRLLERPELARLRRLDALAQDDRVSRYEALRERHGPRSGSAGAAAQGAASKRRGAEVEALSAKALQALAARLDAADGEPGRYRVASSLRVPASILAGRERAKAEWDVVLLRRADDAFPRVGDSADARPSWDVCLIVEAKASVDAATSDLPRLRRGLALLAEAQEGAAYSFEAAGGPLSITGRSLRALGDRHSDLARSVLYCCDAPAETSPRLLGAASRMQLLSAPASLAYAARFAEGQEADIADLVPVWHELLESSRWKAVLNQHPMLREVRELMVHVDDLMDAVGAAVD